MTEKESNETQERVNRDLEDLSRRSLMKKGALATSALALGLGSVSNASAQDRDVLVYTYDYYPNVQFRIVQQLQQSATVKLLTHPGGNEIPEISQPDDYIGYVIRYDLGNNGGDGKIATFLFLRSGRTLDEGLIRRFSGNASIFSSELNLLSTTLRR